MILTADPEKTFAVVVGVEKYALGPQYNLNGPAHDGVRFARWLRSRGVPAKNISLCLSSIEDRGALLGGLDVPAGDAKWHLIESAFLEKLAAPDLGGELLFIFWGGHGVARNDLQRYLFVEEAQANNMKAVNFTSLLSKLRSKQAGRFRQQIGIVDSCANFFEELKLKNLTEINYQHNDPDPRVKQLVLFAAAAGETAKNNVIRRTGEFSSFLLDLLEKDAARPWPDFGLLTQSAQQYFRDLAASGNARQTPVYFNYDDPSQGSGVVGEIPVSGKVREQARASGIAVGQLRRLGVILLNAADLREAGRRDALYGRLPPDVRQASARDEGDPESDLLNILGSAFGIEGGVAGLLDAFERLDLEPVTLQTVRENIERFSLAISVRDLLKKVPITTSEMRRCYVRSSPDWQRAPEVIDLDQAVENLLDMPPRRAGAAPPLLEFVERISRKYDQAALSEWVDKNARTMQMVADLRESLRDESEGGSDTLSYLIVDLPDELPSRLEYWLLNDEGGCEVHNYIDCPPTPEGVRAGLVKIISEAETVSEGQIVLELFVPAHLLSCDADQWEVCLFEQTVDRLGAVYPVLLRWRDRAVKKGLLQKDWVSLTNRIRRKLERNEALSALWIEPGSYTGAKVMSDLKGGEYGDCISFLFVPIEERSKKVNDLLIAGLRAGAPLALWGRKAPSDWRAFKTKLEHFLVSGTLEAMPQKLKIIRAEATAAAAADADHLGCSLTLFWDDPERNPMNEQLRPIGR
ncbi:MAG TPA: hypothetical protein VE262_23225 [Blastocatellia bacterium]|nr:hypothetical protein [Blastocatellia bacterium]